MSLISSNTRVQNSELVAAIVEQGTRPSAEATQVLRERLGQAKFLAGVMPQETGTSPGEMKFVTAEHSGKIYLPLFTDWEALGAYTQREVQALVLEAADAWDFALRKFDAIVINPANDALPLERHVLEDLIAQGD